MDDHEGGVGKCVRNLLVPYVTCIDGVEARGAEDAGRPLA